MPNSFLRRQVVTAALTANALHPVPGYWAGIPSMFAGWMTTELAPHLAAATAVDTLTQLTRRPRDGHGQKQAVGLAVASIAGLAYLIRQAQASKDDVERALIEALGEDYRDDLTKVYTDIDMACPGNSWRCPSACSTPRSR